jgi:hypothetical protein
MEVELMLFFKYYTSPNPSLIRRNLLQESDLASQLLELKI